ncbi:hypothetical protein NHX12_018826 [Muraenolepis orangiensis]|uniref:Uncharacterized protein n=1 Tax=Muraenolepis orangiensis TaxID=630683 RepID=A0A9Q0F0C8_9TELE|nr:hypothetical protein NHX12_018826 [Muraenolepis orangiensis]
MEDYEEFVSSRLSELRKNRSSTPPPGRRRSLICFYGRSILPPLLSQERREEMRTSKEHLKKSKADGRVIHIQNLLHSIQLRKAPTLQEFFEEKSGLHILSDSNATSSASSSQRVHGLETKDHLSFSPPPGLQDEHITPKVAPLTSTTCTEISLHHPKPPQQYQDQNCFLDENEVNPHSQPITDPFVDISHQSQSSGYVTYDNADTATSVLTRVESVREGCLLSSVEGGLKYPSNRTKMQNIISHPPIDGETLERSAHESSIEDCSLSAESGPPVQDLTTLGTNQEIMHKLNEQINEHPSAQYDAFDQDENASGRECPTPPIGGGTDSSHYSTTTNPEPQDQEEDQADALNHDADIKPFEEPYRLSLQALLKKSQEYRQQQRMLRSQARNSRVILESLSDKENDEFPHKATMRRKTKQETCIENQAEMSLNKPCENEQKLKGEDLPSKESNDVMKTVGLSSTGNANTGTLGRGQNKTLPENNPPVFSPTGESPTKPVDFFVTTLSDISAHSPAHFSPPRNESTIRSLSNKGTNFHVIPTPQLCTSPVHCKGLSKTGGSQGASPGPNTKVLVQTANNVDRMFETGENDASSVAHLNQVDLPTMLSRSSAHTQHIDQLELNLSCLKLLISELESTITENRKNQSQPENRILPAGFCDVSSAPFLHQTYKEQRVWVGPNDSYNGDKSLHGDWSPAEGSAWQRRQSLDHDRNNEEDTDPELHFIDLPRIRPHKRGDADVCVNKGSTGLSLVLGGGGETANRVQGTVGASLARGIVAMSSREQAGSKRPQPSAKRITSVTQRMLIPDVFRETPLSPVTVLSDTSNQPPKRPQAMVEEGSASSCWVSLNRSYHVDRPSDSSGSELLTYGPHVPDNEHLTPESRGGGGQVGVSKAKRRLLMHTKKEAQERRLDSGKGAGPLVHALAYASTPKASPQERGGQVGQGDQQQLNHMHAAQWEARQEKQGRQQQQVLQLGNEETFVVVGSPAPTPFSITSTPFSITSTHLYKHTHTPFSITSTPFSITSTPFSITSTPFSITSTPFSITPTPFSITSTPFSITSTHLYKHTHTPFSITSTPFSITSTPFSITSTPFSITSTPFSITPTPFSITSTPFSITSTPFSITPTPFSITSTPFSITPTPFSITPTPHQ